MTPSLMRKLGELAERHQEVALLLAQGETINDPNRFRDLSKEYAQLEPVVKSLQAYDDAGQALAARQPEGRQPERCQLAGRHSEGRSPEGRQSLWRRCAGRQPAGAGTRR